MRSEAEIRKEISDCQDSQKPECECRDCEGHRLCVELLKWVLGEKDIDPYLAEERSRRLAEKRKQKDG